MPRKTKEEAEKTRQAIMRAAEDLFYLKGVVSTSLQEIAKAAKVTRGAVYWHFKNKVDLLRALADDLYLPHEDMMNRIAGADLSDPLGALSRMCRDSLNALANDPHRRRLLTILTQRCEYIEEMAALVHRNNLCRDKIRQQLSAIFAQAQRKKKLACSWTPQAAALAMQSMVIGFIHGEMDYTHPSRARDKARCDAIDSFMGSLATAGG